MRSGKSSPRFRRQSDDDIWAQQQGGSPSRGTRRDRRDEDNDTITVSLPEMVNYDEIGEAQMIIRRDRVTHYSEVGKLRAMRKKRQGWDCTIVCEKVRLIGRSSF